MNIFKRSALVNVDGDAVVKDALKLLSRRIEQPSRRAFLQRSLTLGGVALLSGCSLTDDASVDTVLASISRLNDRVQGALFDPNRMAPTYPDSMITRPFPFNAYYGEDEIRRSRWRLLAARSHGPGRGQAQLVAGRPAHDAAARAGHAAHLRRGLERHRQVGRRAVLALPASAWAPT